MSNALLDAALAFQKAGASVLPAKKNKKPKLATWTAYQDRLPTEHELIEWFNGTPFGIAALNGRVSGNHETIDFDNKHPGEAAQNRAAWVALVEAEAPGLIGRLAEQTTPSGGFHFKYRTDTVLGNHKLAQRPATDEEKQADPHVQAMTLIETRGEGGYALVDPSPGYHVVRGDFANPPYITPEEQAILHAAAAALNTYCKPSSIVSVQKAKSAPSNTDGILPGADFNERGDVEPVLKGAGWVKVQNRDNGSDWRRPGKKDKGISATLDIVAPGVFYVFTTNAAPFDNEHGYDPFAVYTLLNHDGDYGAAASALAREGYGSRPEPTLDAQGFALCPNCGLRLDPDKSGKGYHCPKEGNSLCYWWKGEGYTHPARGARYGLRGGTKTAQEADSLADPPARRYLTEDEIDTLRPPTWLIKGVIAAGEVTLISGPGDAGKTFIATDMMKRVAQHYPVMYAALEDAPGIRIRKRAWEIYHQMPKNGNFLMWTHGIDLFDAASVDSFIAEVLPLGLRMITIDTLSRGLGGADENSNTDIAIVMNHVERIAHETGAAVDLLHHTTKDGQAYRGASALKNNTYGHIEISRDDDQIQFTIARIKNTPEQPSRYFKLASVSLPDVVDDDGNEVSSAVILPADRVPTGDRITGNQVRMLETLMLMTDAQGGATTTDLAKATQLVGNSFYGALKRLRGLGLITKGDNARDPLTITGAGRARLSVESTNPEHQPDGRPVLAASPFEVNPHLDASLPLLPSLPGSDKSLPNDPGSNSGSDTLETTPVEAITTTSLPRSLSAPGAETTVTTKSLPTTPGSNNQLLPTYHTPLGVVVGSNRGSDGLSHDQRRRAEVDKALRDNDVHAARKAADLMQGNIAKSAALQKIDDHRAAHIASEVTP